MRARDLGLACGSLPPGSRNSLADVPGVTAGHRTLVRGEGTRTGVTAILPHGGRLFREKLPAAVHVLNGFGKSTGLVQIEELGEMVRARVLAHSGVGLEWEIKRMGEFAQ